MGCSADDTLDFRNAIGTQVGGGVGGACLFAEVDASGKFADDHDVDALQVLRLERRNIQNGFVYGHRTQVRIEAQRFAQPQNALFGTYLEIRVREARIADSAEQDGVSTFR